MKLKFICLVFLNIVYFKFIRLAQGTTYCAPLIAPETTNLTCSFPNDYTSTDCSTSWLPFETVANYQCWEQKVSHFRKGRMICNGTFVPKHNSKSEVNYTIDQPLLPCNISEDRSVSGLHFYSYHKLKHYQTLFASNDTGFASLGPKLHNEFRKKHGALPLEPDELMNRRAQSWAENLASRNLLDMSAENSLGQNVFNSDQDDKVLAVNDAVQFWYFEGIANYNWSNIKSNWNNPLALDFSQIVWKSTRKLGLGAASRNKSKANGTVVVAFYFPMGNIVLEDDPQPEKLFLENVVGLQTP